MKAAVCYEYGKPLVVEDINIAPPGPGDVKVKLAATAVCHSDIHIIKGELPFPRALPTSRSAITSSPRCSSPAASASPAPPAGPTSARPSGRA